MSARGRACASAVVAQHRLTVFKRCGCLSAFATTHCNRIPPPVLQKEFDMYWHPRFTLVVPRDLVDHFFPFLSQLEERMSQVCNAAAAALNVGGGACQSTAVNST